MTGIAFEVEKQRLDSTNYHSIAEGVIKSLGRPHRFTPGKLSFELTTSKIRNLLTLVNQIYNDAVLIEGNLLSDSLVSRITYLNVRMIYEAGRERSVEAFLNKSNLIDMLKGVGNDQKKFLLFCRYFESLVAYHRFHGGQD